MHPSYDRDTRHGWTRQLLRTTALCKSVSGLEGGSLPRRPTKRRNAVLRYYDAPLYTDWAAWSTAFWTLVSGLSVGFGDENNTSSPTLPSWADGLLAALVFGLLLGLAPAMIRLGLRRRIAERHRRLADDSHSGIGALPPDALAAHCCATLMMTMTASLSVTM
jgi:hypothetical protein